MISATLKGTLDRIDFIFDSYLEMSPKPGERLRRYGKEYITIHSITDDVPLTVQSQKFWGSVENKIKLQTYIRKYLLQHANYFWEGVEIICSATNIEPCQSCASARISSSLDTLQRSDIEEADMRIMIHIAHALRDGNKYIYIQ